MFLHCLTENFKNELVENNFKLMYSYESKDQTIWVLAIPRNYIFSENVKEGVDYFLSKKISF